MRSRRYSEEEKDEALKLVGLGVTYKAIQEKTGVPKSTLALWVASKGKVRDRSKQLIHLEKARTAATKAIREKKVRRELVALNVGRAVSNKLDILDSGIGKALLAMLYWAEGGKQIGNMKFTNTDPELVHLFLSLLRKCYSVDEERLRIGLHIHSYHDPQKTISFWSDKLQIPPSQFWKVYTKPRSGKRHEYRRNFYGICNVHYASTAIQRELLAIGREIGGKLADS